MDCFDAFKPKYLCGILQFNVGKTEDREQVVIGCRRNQTGCFKDPHSTFELEFQNHKNHGDSQLEPFEIKRPLIMSALRARLGLRRANRFSFHAVCGRSINSHRSGVVRAR